MAAGSGSVALAEKLQSLNGLFAIHKKKGPTSADVLNILKTKLLKEAGIKQHPMKRKRQALKLGHGGTLDSAASGVLVVGIGKGTKMLSGMLSCSKKYTTVGELGKATDTFDALGMVTEEQSYDHITKNDLESILKKFTGNVMQTPPLYSALKQNGQRLSCLMKKGEAVEAKPARPVVVFDLSVQDYNPPLFTLNVECGGGFYVRSLVNDLGKELSSCAHVKELIRTKQGPFTLDEHALQEEKWTIDEVVKAIESCTELVSSEGACKKLKMNPQENTEQVKEAD
ncbi:probable tRNA pseudouridine synthase 1 isoform X1 [Scyliorhinus canicula]|uniref:probable tRNA pseudouridine synthase 1 isoform X1 n=1 Tax=Scyliorhinus canicula TaxID=7830 RepID=UPI0018F7AFFD|nr:probable tRNA pseudouridine synthase 1 isoform X1 [Scyliorhinus canicula]